MRVDQGGVWDLRDLFEEKGFLLSPDLELGDDAGEFLKFLERMPDKPLVVTKELYYKFKSGRKKGPNYKVLFSYKEGKGKKVDINDWLIHFNKRYEKMSSLLKNRMEIKDALSIDRLKSSSGRTRATLIAMVMDKRKTSKDNIILELEDPTGIVNGIVSFRKRKVFEKAEELLPDEVIGVVGVKSGNFFFVEDIIFPDIPQKERKTSPVDGLAAFIADMHVGSKMFLKDHFERFIKWLRGEIGNEKQKELARRIKYLFILGDLVDGVGVYPEQYKELEVKDIYEQYSLFSKYVLQIPEDKIIFIIPGNHDAVRLEEPQPPIYKDLLEEVYGLDNVVMLSNPAYVNIHSYDDFPGFNVLLYHGYSFDFFVSNLEKLRAQGGYDASDKIMELVLRKRHLAPTFGAVPTAPLNEDYLVIEDVPDIFATAHIHKSKVGMYKNVILLSASCWQDTTTFQQRVGHHPEPGKVPIVDLKTGKVTVLNFI
ncbi:MAG TPA: DNA-directed DNA polymerase II small subunit [Candidatus Aenigmarchaeota archaeon]|nr:DNA-directed DNA polymerase II small subunit [Candidatus Aenigmarchaeota archaeon]